MEEDEETCCDHHNAEEQLVVVDIILDDGCVEYAIDYGFYCPDCTDEWLNEEAEKRVAENYQMEFYITEFVERT